jgi:hypothetical protein
VVISSKAHVAKFPTDEPAMRREFTQIMKLQTGNSVVLFSGFSVTDGRAFSTLSDRRSMNFFVPMLTAIDRHTEFSESLVTLALMAASAKLRVTRDDAIAYEAAKSSAGALGAVLQDAVRSPKTLGTDFISKGLSRLQWMGRMTDKDHVPLLIEGLLAQLGNQRPGSGVLRTNMWTSEQPFIRPWTTQHRTTRELDLSNLLLALRDDEACVAPLAMWAMRHESASQTAYIGIGYVPVPRGADSHTAARTLLRTFWWEYRRAVNQYHRLSMELLSDPNYTVLRGYVGDAKGEVGEVVVRFAARMRVLARNGTIIEARGHRQAEQLLDKAMWKARKPATATRRETSTRRASPTGRDIPAYSAYAKMRGEQAEKTFLAIFGSDISNNPSGHPLRIDSFPLLRVRRRKPTPSTALTETETPAQRKVRDAREDADDRRRQAMTDALYQQRKDQILAAIEVLVAETQAARREQVLCIAVGGNNPAADEMQLRATYHAPPTEVEAGRVELSMELLEVKFGYLTKRERSGKVHDASDGLEDINNLLAERAERNGRDAFPTRISSATLSFLYLGPPRVTSAEEDEAYTRAVSTAAEAGLQVKILEHGGCGESECLKPAIESESEAEPEPEPEPELEPVTARGSCHRRWQLY